MNEINNELSDIKIAIATEKQQREDGTEEIVKQIEEQLHMLEEDILLEQKVRIETSDRLKALIQDKEANLEREIEVNVCDSRWRPKREKQ